MPRVRRDGVVHVIAEEKCVKVTQKKQVSCDGDAWIIRDP